MFDVNIMRSGVGIGGDKEVGKIRSFLIPFLLQAFYLVRVFLETRP